MIKCPLCTAAIDAESLVCPKCGTLAKRAKPSSNRKRSGVSVEESPEERMSFVTPMSAGMSPVIIEKLGRLVLAGEDDRAVRLYRKHTGESAEEAHEFIAVFRESLSRNAAAGRGGLLKVLVVLVVLSVIAAAGYGLMRLLGQG